MQTVRIDHLLNEMHLLQKFSLEKQVFVIYFAYRLIIFHRILIITD